MNGVAATTDAVDALTLTLGRAMVEDAARSQARLPTKASSGRGRSAAASNGAERGVPHGDERVSQ